MQQFPGFRKIILRKLFFVYMISLFSVSSFAEIDNKAAKQKLVKSGNDYSELSITKVIYKNKTLIVRGNTDLPNDSLLQIELIPEDGTAKESLFAEAIVEGGSYGVDIEVPQKPELYKGPYKIEVTFSLGLQKNIKVLHLIGNGAENLTGDLVHREPITGYKMLQYSVTKPLFALQMEKYSLDDPKKFIKGSPEYVLTFFLTKWSEKDWKGMLDYSYKPWVISTENPQEQIESWFKHIQLVGVDIIRTVVSNPLMVEIKLKLHYTDNKSKGIHSKIINVKIIKDDKGSWGVFPISVIEQHAIFNMSFN